MNEQARAVIHSVTGGNVLQVRPQETGNVENGNEGTKAFLAVVI